jgi:hypothetical protein
MGIGAQTVSCGWSDPVVRFVGGEKACFKEFPLLIKAGVISTDQSMSYSAIAERHGSRYAIAISSNPQHCPFVTYTSWRQGGREATEALNYCQERLRSVQGSIRSQPVCSCEILIDGGESNVTRAKFKEKTELYERQLTLGRGPLENVSNQLALSASNVSVVNIVSDTSGQLDGLKQEQEQERQRLLREANDKEVAELNRLRQAEQERIAKLAEQTRFEQEREQREQKVQAAALEVKRLKAESDAASKIQTESMERLQLERLAADKRQRDLEEQLQIAQLQLLKQQSVAPQKSLDAHALVIGNSSYPGNALANPANDARAMAEKLRSMGFKVTEALDLDRVRFSNTLSQFSKSAAFADVTLLFYAGHGSQISGNNYMLPIDLNMSDLGQVPLFGIALNAVVEHYLPGKTKLVFLDACRDNPLMQVASRAVSKGLAAMAVSEGTLIAYATKDGQVAQDGVGSKNSPFTSALLEHIGDPDDIAVVLRKVRDKVMRATGGRQQPWEYGSLTGGALVLSGIKPK